MALFSLISLKNEETKYTEWQQITFYTVCGSIRGCRKIPENSFEI